MVTIQISQQLSVQLSVVLSVWLSVCLSVQLSVSLSVQDAFQPDRIVSLSYPMAVFSKNLFRLFCKDFITNLEIY